MKKVYIPILIFALIALGAAIYLTYLDFLPADHPPTICDISDTFSCTTISQTKYAFIFGIPVAILGLIGSALLIFASIFSHRHSDKAILLFSIVGFAMSVYLTIIEIILGVFCIFCLISAAMMILALIYSLIKFLKPTIRWLKANIEFVD
jgi:uncharacterized membrane protein